MATWADAYITELQAGKKVSFRPSGHSMEPLIKMGQLVTLEPVNHYNGVDAASIVLATTPKGVYLHRIDAFSNVGHIRWYRIAGTGGNSNGWVTEDKLHGVLTSVSD